MPSEKRSFWQRIKDNGLTLPGYRYLGPFNSLDNGQPTGQSDTVAQEHDGGYKVLQERGEGVYLTYNDADEQTLDKWGDDYGGRIANWYFKKKKQAAQLGIIPTSTYKVQRQDVLTALGKRLKPQLPEQPNKRLRRSIAPDILGKRKRVDHLENPYTRLRQAANNLRQNLGLNRSFLNPTTRQQVATNVAMSTGAGKGSGNTSGLTETPIDDVWNVSRGPPNYTFASLPWLKTRYVSGKFHSYDHVFRLTSPYDPEQAASNTDTNTGTGTQNEYSASPTDTALLPARWYNWYATQYKYYHTVACRYHITLENLSMNPLWVHVMMRNDENPPQGATNEDMRMWPGTKSYYVPPLGYAILPDGYAEVNQQGAVGSGTRDQDEKMAQAGDGNFETGNNISNNKNNIVKISGEYSPGDFNRDIRLDADVENWTAYNANPKLPERLFIRVRPESEATVVTSSGSQISPMSFKISCEFDYLVEFKELQDGIKYPLSRQPIIATIQDTRSAGAADETAVP